MRWLLFVALATVGGCASMNQGGGVSGAAVVSGQSKVPAANSGAPTDSIATNGSTTTGEALP